MKQRNRLIFLALILSLLIRLLYFQKSPGVAVMPDSIGYYNEGIKMVDRGIFAHESRPPVYPLLLNLIMYAFGKFKTPVYSTDFNAVMKTVFVLQTIIGLLSLWLIFKILNQFTTKSRFLFLFVLFAGFNIMIFSLERAILTESLALFFLLIITFFLLRIIQAPRLIYFILLEIFYLLSLFLKPIFLALPYITLPVIIYYLAKNKQVWLYSFLCFIITTFAIFYYIKVNEKFNDYKGFSRIGEINQLGLILYYQLPPDAGKNYTYFYQNVLDTQKRGGDIMPYRFLEYYDPLIWSHQQKLNDLGKFNSAVIMANLPQFLMNSFLQIPKAVLTTNELLFLPYDQSGASFYLFYTLFRFYAFCQYLLLIAFLIFPVILIAYLIKRTLLLAILTILGIIGFFQIILTTTSTFFDIGRVMTLTQIHLYLFLFIILIESIPSILKKYIPILLRFGHSA